MKADLHMHSTDSDGKKTPEELFQLAQKNNINLISITDHDVVKNVVQNVLLSKKYGVSYIPGIELSTVEQRKPVHILGYFTDDSYQSQEMISYYKEIKKAREDRAKTFIKNLDQLYNIKINYDDVYRLSNGIIARPHIAKAITEKYPQYDHNYIFDHFIGDHTKAYVPTCELTVKEGIDLLRRNNCIVILAHPTLLKRFIHDDVLEYNFDGLEAIYYQNKDNDEDLYRSIASKKGIIITGGSDYHGIKNDQKHGDIGEIYLESEDVEIFLKMYNKVK